MVANGSGKPPRSSSEIRAAIESIRDKSEATAPAGPLTDGPSPDHRIVIASFFDREVARQHQRKLGEAGIFSSLEVRRRRTELIVDYEDHGRAGQVLDEFREHCPDRPHFGIRRDFDYLILGIAIGVTVGSCFLIRARNNLLAILPLIAFGVTGALVGHLCDRLLGAARRSSRFRFGLRELLILATLPALVAFLWQLTPRLLK